MTRWQDQDTVVKMNTGSVGPEAGGMLQGLGSTWPQISKAWFRSGNEDGVSRKEGREGVREVLARSLFFPF